MADAAFRAGYRILGFSSHAPLPWETGWNLSWGGLEAYARAIRALAARWRPDGLKILLGLETDWVRESISPSDPRYAAIDPDYLIGSVHYVTTDLGEAYTVDEPEADFEMHLRSRAGGKMETVWREYYRNMGSLIEEGGFDIIGHFDLVKKNNKRGNLFDEESPAYLNAAFAAVDFAAERGLVAEINTGGMARGKTEDPYPSLSILRRMAEKGLRITLGDDAHHTSHIGAYRHAALGAAENAGYRSIWYLEGKKAWREIPLDDAERIY
jgi:histidinol-phosphatase (PHP family)